MAIELTPDLQYRLTEMLVHASEVTAEIAYAGLPTRLAFTTNTVDGNPMSLEGWSLEQRFGEDEDATWEIALNLDQYDDCDWSTDGALVFAKNGHRLTLSYAMSDELEEPAGT